MKILRKIVTSTRKVLLGFSYISELRDENPLICFLLKKANSGISFWNQNFLFNNLFIFISIQKLLMKQYLLIFINTAHRLSF